MAKNLRRPYELVTDDGTMIRGVIESGSIDRMIEVLSEEFDVPDDLMEKNGSKILIAPWILQEISSDIESNCYLSEVYPTWDGLEVERIPLNNSK
jgi:pyruvate formate-lyase activating enzyme-like uncharacterized protein